MLFLYTFPSLVLLSGFLQKLVLGLCYEQLEPLSLTIPEKRFLFGRKRLKRKQKLIVCKGRLNPMLLNKEG
jgi:hypothetical protein